MAGRHGNKVIVSKIVTCRRYAVLADGTRRYCVKIRRCTVSYELGKDIEAVLAWAGKELGVKFATPIFDGASLDDLNEWCDKANIPHYGKSYLYDGGTGERFDQPATVGVTYFLKLGHMVEDKMHARSIGPYSLITQQPLGGKAQFGGHVLEKWSWALEAFGAGIYLAGKFDLSNLDV